MRIDINLLLEEIKQGVKTRKDRNEIKVDGIAYRWEELNILLDYITNLQQENEKLKKDVKLFKSDLISCTNTGLSLITKIDKAIELLELKQLRYLNEDNYRICTLDLQEVKDILQNGVEEK